jgi:Tol biopolymer transport system component
MRKTFLLVAACVMSMLASAQIFEVKSVQALPNASYHDAKVAAVSPKGDYVLMTTQSGDGLKRYDLATGKLTTISEAKGSGYEVKISTDGKEIAYQEVTIGSDRLLRSDIIRMNIAQGQRRVVAQGQRKLDKFVIIENAPVLTNEEGLLYLTKGGKKQLIAPFGTDYIYIWGSLSPDKTKICYYIGERGCYVCDLNGKNNQFIGFDCTAAQWYDNNTLISMRTTDDGYDFTSSVIEAYTLDGKRQTLTDKSMLATFPYAVNGKIIFTTWDKGTTYVMNVKK